MVRDVRRRVGRLGGQTCTGSSSGNKGTKSTVTRKRGEEPSFVSQNAFLFSQGKSRAWARTTRSRDLMRLEWI